MQKYRQSNFELLRILCMLGVLTTHVLQSCYPSLHAGDFSVWNEFRILLMNMSIVAVNCFIMISGFFRIKQTFRSFLNLYVQSMFYCGVFSVIGLIFGLESFIGVLVKTIFPFTEGGMWFMTAYFALFLISPLLNAGFDALDNKKKNLMLVGLILVDMYIGYMHQCKEVSLDGYHVIHFITIYYIGMFLSKSNVSGKMKWGWCWFVVVLIMTLLHMAKMKYPPVAVIYSMRYNSPSVLLASVLLFQWVRTWSIKSRVINWIAVSVLSVYVIHSQTIVSNCFFGFLKSVSLDSAVSPVLSACIIMGTTIGLYAVCILLDKVRIAICSPVVNICANKIEMWTKRKSIISNSKE